MAMLDFSWGHMAWQERHPGGSPLLLLHGTGCDHSDWDAVWSRLPPSIHVMAADFRGHGDSDTPAATFSIGDLADDVNQLIQHLDLRGVVVAGHSLGGMVAMEAARRYAGRVAGLVLFEGWTNLRACGAFRDPRFYGALAPEAVVSIQAKSDATRARFAPAAWQAFWESVEQFDAHDLLKGAAIPVDEVYGGMGRWEGSVGLLRIPANPRIELTWIEGAGHYLPHERPAEVAAICRRASERAVAACHG